MCTRVILTGIVSGVVLVVIVNSLIARSTEGCTTSQSSETMVPDPINKFIISDYSSLPAIFSGIRMAFNAATSL